MSKLTKAFLIMSLSKETKEEYLINLLQELITTKENSNLIELKTATRIGFVLSYYLHSILQKIHDSNIKGKWIDFVEWNNLNVSKSNKITGRGDLWWGFRKDVSKTFSENFYCELELSDDDVSVLYLFRFQIDGKDYDLTG